MLKNLTRKLHAKPLAVGSAAIYPYLPNLLEACERTSRYDSTEVFNLARVVGSDFSKRLWLPRNMAPVITEDLRVDGLDYEFKSNFVPRNDEQARCIKEAVALLKQGENFIFEAPTGFGKTWCTMDIIAKVGKKTIVVVTKEDVYDQWVEAAQKILGLSLGHGIGTIVADKVLTVNQGVIIAMVQSIAKEGRYPESIFRDAGLVIWDECHRVGADFFSQSCFRMPAKLRMGISATPNRKDGREEVIAAHIGPTMVRTEAAPLTPRIIAQESPWHIPMRRAVDKEGKLILDEDGKPKMVQIDHSPTKCGHVIKMLVHHHGRNAMIANFVSQAYKSGRQILVQSDTKEHLEILATLFGSFGIPPQQIAYYVGGMSRSSRSTAKTARVIMATYQMTREATDIPSLDTLVMSTPKADVVQIAGRILRAFDGKKEPLIFDVRDSSSSVFKGYARTRADWYRKIKAKLEERPAPKMIDKPVKSARIAAPSPGA